MTVIPERVAESDLSQLLTSKLTRIHQGKVRDTYELPGNLLLVVVTERISIFDFVLPATVTNKGHILTALTIHWLTNVLQSTQNHLVAFGEDIEKYLPVKLRRIPSLKKQAIVVTRQEMLPVECIVRGYLTGSGWSSYQRNGTVCGIQLPEGLHDGSKLPEPIFTPTTKAEEGHDEHLDAGEVIEQYGDDLRQQSIAIYQTLADYAQQRGVILADTKFEFGEGLILADEVGTPDSSRFWDVEEWKTAATQKKSPSPHDKQLVRDWGKTQGIHKLDPDDPTHLKLVSQLKVHQELLDKTTKTYHDIFARLTSQSLDDFTRDVMHI